MIIIEMQCLFTFGNHIVANITNDSNIIHFSNRFEFEFSIQRKEIIIVITNYCCTDYQFFNQKHLPASFQMPPLPPRTYLFFYWRFRKGREAMHASLSSQPCVTTLFFCLMRELVTIRDSYLGVGESVQVLSVFRLFERFLRVDQSNGCCSVFQIF